MNRSRTALTVLVLWNQVEDDAYAYLRERGAIPLAWDPSRMAAEVRTVHEEMDDLLDALARSGHRVECVNVRDDMTVLQSALLLYRPDVVFNLVEYFHDDAGMEGNVVGMFELLGHAYTGSDGYTLALCQRKHHTKALLDSAGLPTARYFVVAKLGAPIPEPERFPVIVKPALEDASGGIENDAVVRDQAELTARVEYVLREFEQPALVEEYIDGRELHVALLGNDEPEVLPLFEMRFDTGEHGGDGESGDLPGDLEADGWRPRIVSYSGKWDPLSRDFYALAPVCPATDIDPELEERLGAIAVQAYTLTGCRDYARVDMRVTADGAPYILEVNPNPDLTDGSAFIMCAEASGRSYVDTLGEIVALAAARARDSHADQPDREPVTDHLLRRYKADGDGAADVAADAGDPDHGDPDQGSLADQHD